MMSRYKVVILFAFIVLFSCKKEGGINTTNSASNEYSYSCPGNVSVLLTLKDSISNNPIVGVSMYISSPYSASMWTDSTGFVNLHYCWDPCAHIPSYPPGTTLFQTNWGYPYYGEWDQNLTGYNDGDTVIINHLLNKSGVIHLHLIDTSNINTDINLLDFKMGSGTWDWYCPPSSYIYLPAGVDTNIYRYAIPNRMKHISYGFHSDTTTDQYMSYDTIVSVGSGDTLHIVSYVQ